MLALLARIAVGATGINTLAEPEVAHLSGHRLLISANGLLGIGTVLALAGVLEGGLAGG